MLPDEEGFLYPHIEETNCIHCGLCEQVCQYKNSKDHNEPAIIYAAKNKDDECRMRSSSGGMFSLLAEYIENQGGVIYGAAFDDKLRVYHQRATHKQEWVRFRKSKYVQSDLKKCFEDVKRDLESDLTVLFTGTLCQIEGLNYYLKEIKTDKLLTCDVVCFGVPSPKIWKEYLTLIEKEKKKQISEIVFRDKNITGWHNSSISFIAGDGDILCTSILKENAFHKMFSRQLILRPSCYQCKYTSFNRCGDITLADYWGVEKEFLEFDDDKGISFVLCNSEKGLFAWKAVCNKTEFFEITKKQCEQPRLLRAEKEKKPRILFWNIYKHFGLTTAMKILKVQPLSKLEILPVKAIRMFLRVFKKL